MTKTVDFGPLFERHPRGKGLAAWSPLHDALELTFFPLGEGYPGATRHISRERLEAAGPSKLATLFAAEVQALSEDAVRAVHRAHGPAPEYNPYKAALRGEGENGQQG